MTTRTLVAVIDQGSTATKGGVYTLGGECLLATTRPVERIVDGPSVRNDARRIADDVEAILGQLASEHAIDAIGLACQRSTCLLWDRQTGEPLTDALSWQDRSQAERVEAIEEHAVTVAERTGLRLSPYYSAPKLAALLETTDGGGARAEAGELVAGTLDAYLVHRLTGRPSTEPGSWGRMCSVSIPWYWSWSSWRNGSLKPGLSRLINEVTKPDRFGPGWKLPPE